MAARNVTRRATTSTPVSRETTISYVVLAPGSTEPVGEFTTIRAAQDCIKQHGQAGWRLETKVS